jgi:hypothetical protein
MTRHLIKTNSGTFETIREVIKRASLLRMIGFGTRAMSFGSRSVGQTADSSRERS